MNYLESNNTMGFKPGYSRATQLLNVSEVFQHIWNCIMILTVFIWILQRHLVEYHIINYLTKFLT